MLKSLEIAGFKSFAKKTELSFDTPITAVVGPNGSGKSNVAEALRWVLGEQSTKRLRGRRGEDLIFNGSQGASRLSRASAAIVFGNAPLAGRRPFDIDFDEVRVEREVHRDGSNSYSINGSPVRLRDVMELLSAVSLGPSGHHIISQGEADRVLNANSRERRDFLEDALGLKIYQFKKVEAEKKLGKTDENLEQVKSLRREIAPHLKFLQKQVEEIQKAAEHKRELLGLSLKYFGVEDSFIKSNKTDLTTKRSALSGELNMCERELGEAQEKLGGGEETEHKKEGELRALRQQLRDVTRERDEEARKEGRLEGSLEARDEMTVENLSTGEEVCKYCGQVIAAKTTELEERNRARKEHLAKMRAEYEEVKAKVAELTQRERILETEIAAIEDAIKDEMSKVRESERALYDLKAKRSELRSELDKVEIRLESVLKEEEDFHRDIADISILVGEPIQNAITQPLGGEEVGRKEQVERRRKIERLKIKVEEMGGGGDDIMREYDETTKRDQHLVSEVEDLEKSAESLRELMADLDRELADRFEKGLRLVNVEFNNFFGVLFGGGGASLALTELARPRRLTDPTTISEEDIDEMRDADEDSEKREYGIDIKVSLPRKKIRGLEMLSGGERALTSIALIFAMSQVNPPPFLVLDETDAALDEANSKRYGDMIEELSKKTQLILITHNRETMGRAGVLYGVTMGSGSISKLLSLKFDDATTYAK